ncbi:cation:proton antiporter domain-containing protein [Rhodococcoides corynebacterioides]|uniref:cation:proton antiporter domain-containing protein n=1 Tax=Rhodococcoides corynebacterioides TaxID=53972 RepID=UPI003F7E0670
MGPFVVVGLCVGLACLLVSRSLAARRISASLIVVVAGMIVAPLTGVDLTELIDAPATEKVVELVLALLLFVDATEVRGGLFGGERSASVRLLALALPGSMALALGLGAVLFTDLPLAVLAVIACVVVPTDLSPASTLLRDHRIPLRVRRLLNVESGYNDGIVAPIFVIALALIDDDGPHESTAEAVLHGIQASVVAGGVGAVVGYGGARAIRFVVDRGLADPRGVRLAVVLLVFLSYTGATVLSGNGFVAAFVAGIVFHASRTAGRTVDTTELAMVEDLAVLSSTAMWFVFGATVSYLIGVGLPGWEIVVFVAAALTVVRILPTRLALLRSDFARRDRSAVAMLGPRGSASIVFGLLAWNEMADLDDAFFVLYVMALTVLASILFHGVAVGRVGAGYVRAGVSAEGGS